MSISLNKNILMIVASVSFALVINYAIRHHWHSAFGFISTFIGSGLWYISSIITILYKPNPDTVFSEDWCRLVWLFAMAALTFSLQLLVSSKVYYIVFGLFFIIALIILVPIYKNIISISFKSKK